MSFQHECPHCHCRFQNRERIAKYCSNSCRAKANAKVTAEQLQEIVESGEFTTRAAKRLGYNDRTIANALRRAGLYRQWRMHRYA